MNECKMKNKQNILFFLLVILFIANIFGTPPPPPPSLPPTTLIVSQAIPCNKNKNGKCLLVKVKENNKTEIITGIKNFAYDNDYIYTIEVKQINEPEYKYIYIKTLERVPINPPITLTIQKPTPCIDNSGEECLLVKRLDISKTETVRIKGFNYDERYICTIVVTELKNSTYDYNYERKLSCKPKPDSSYTIIIEKDGFDVKDYVKYRVEGTNDTIQFPIDHFINANFTIGVRNILKVKEVENNNQTYLEILVPKQPKIFDTLIVSSQTAPCSNNPNLQCLKITATDGWNLENIRSIKNFVFEKGYKYTLQVQKINTYEYVLVEILSKEEDLPCPNPPPTVFYDCDGSEKRIATCNEVIYTNYMLEDDNSMKIRPVDQDIPFFKFYGNICGFTFIEDHKYTLEVKKDGNDYILEKILCDEKKNILPNPNEKKFTNCGNSKAQDNPKFEDEGNKDIALQEKPKPTYKITELDSGVWYLRYLFQADSLIPINNLSDTSYYLTTDTWRNKINIFTPCNFYFDKLSTDEPKKFVYESLTVSLKKCDATTKLIFEQLRNVNHYEINDNKLKLSIYNNDLQDAKVLIVLEGVPKRK